MCVCVCARARACARVCVCMCVCVLFVARARVWFDCVLVLCFVIGNVPQFWRNSTEKSALLLFTAEGQSTVGPTQQMISDVSSWSCQWQLRHPRHGVSVKAIVNCVNGIQLQTSVTSHPVRILLSPPDLSKVRTYNFPNPCAVNIYILAWRGFT